MQTPRRDGRPKPRTCSFRIGDKGGSPDGERQSVRANIERIKQRKRIGFPV